MRDSGAHTKAVRPLVVLGMHRSGTSLLTGLLSLAGIWVGAEEELTVPNDENPKGFFERRDIRAICDALLRSTGAERWRAAEFNPTAVPAETTAEQIETWQRLIPTFDVHGPWAVKEPRLCLVFPLLRPMLDAPVCLHVLRDPLEIARSLQTRNDFGILEGLALWEAYTRGALAGSAGLPRVTIRYDDLVTRPQATLAALSEWLEAVGAVGLDLADSDGIAGFVSPALHRQRTLPGETSTLLSPEQAQLWAEAV